MVKRALTLMTLAAGVMLVTLLASAALMADSAKAITVPSLKIDAPRQVEAGQPIKIRLRVTGAADIGGYETNLLFDTQAAELGGLAQHGKDLTKFGRDVGALGPVEQPWGVSFGAFSCPVDNCVRPGKGPKAKRGIGGTVEPATVTIVPEGAGRLEFRLAATKFVDATGKPVQLNQADRSFVVQVGPRQPGVSHPAPRTNPWDLKNSSPSSVRSPDLTQNESVTHADAMEAAIDWTMLREMGSACGADVEQPSRDVNRDGCIDVADLQTIVANYDTNAANSVPSNNAENANGEPANLAVATISSFFNWMSIQPAVAQEASTFTVNSTGDGADANAGDGTCATSEGVCTLRAAIEETNLHPGADTIAFNIPGTGVKTITLGSTLPTVNDETGPTTIDGYTQPGASPNTNDLISNAKIMVQITPSTTYPTGVYGLTVSSPGNIIRGLAIFKVRKATWLYGPNSTNNTIAGNFIGTNAIGSFGAAAFVDEGEGVAVQNQASKNNVGIASLEGRNVISGNARRGVTLYADCNSNRVVNNIVGLGPAGDKRLANLRIGIDLNLSAANNQIGGTASNERNVVSGNGWEGIELSHGETNTGNNIIGNFVGTDTTGNAAPLYASHERWSVQIEDRPTNNVIADNVIGNSSAGGGILLANAANGTQVRGNRIGISRDGSAIPNARSGVQVDGPSGLPSRDSRIGPGNVIANNGVDGIRIVGEHSDRHTITHNSIFGNAGLGIDLAPLGSPNANDAGDLDSGANQQLNFPEAETATTQQVTGTVCGGCMVEVFLADRGVGAHGQGKSFVGSAVANTDGSFAVPVSGVAEGEHITTTATDTAGNTSEFSPNKVVEAGAPPADTTAPASPTGLTATGGEGNVSLDWDDNTEADLAGYSVYRSTTSGGTYTRLTSSLLTSSTYADNDVIAGTTYYYVISATDTSGNESDSSNEASATPQEATDGTGTSTALSFDGTDDWVSVPTSNLLNKTATNARTYELKIKTSSDVSSRQFVYEEGGGTNGFSVEIEGGRLYFNAWSDSKGWPTVSASGLVSANTVYHVAGVYEQSSGELRLYLDGVLQQSSGGVGTMPWHQDGVALGGIGGTTRDHIGTNVSSGSYYGGLVEEFRGWEGARTQTQIQNNLDSDLTGGESGLIILYEIDEGNGTTLNDSTANNLHGTINGASWTTMEDSNE